jgi:vacuolar protein sorting-associated protein 26
MAAYFFASAVDVEIRLEGEDARKLVDVKPEKDKDKSIAAPVYFDGEGIGGQVRRLSYKLSVSRHILSR